MSQGNAGGLPKLRRQENGFLPRASEGTSSADTLALARETDCGFQTSRA